MTFEELLQSDVGDLEKLTDEELDAILDPVLKQCPPVELVAYMADEEKKKAAKKAVTKSKKDQEKKASLAMQQAELAKAMEMFEKMVGK